MIHIASDPATRLARQPRTPTRLAALSLLSMLLAFGCGNDHSNDTNGAGATGGDGVGRFSGAALCSLSFGPNNAFVGFVRLVSDAELASGEEIDSIAGAIEVVGGVSCAVRGRSVYVYNWESPTITRFDEREGALVEGPRVSFANFGLGSLASESDARQTAFVSDTKAFFLDYSGPPQVILWNPTAMETIGAIPLTLAEPLEGLRQVYTRLGRIDGLLVAYSAYQNELDVLVPRTDVWFIDPETEEVVASDSTERCGALLPATTASNGDLYIGSEPFSAAQHAAGLPGSFPPCAIRIRAGTRQIDTSYLADLNALTGLPTAGPIAVANDQAFFVAYDTTNIPVDPTLTASELTELPNWNFYQSDVGSERLAIRVESIPTGSANAETRRFDGRTFLFRAASDFSQSEFLDLTQSTVEATYTLSDVTWLLSRLGSEPDARMARRINYRGAGR